MRGGGSAWAERGNGEEEGGRKSKQKESWSLGMAGAEEEEAGGRAGGNGLGGPASAFVPF